MLRGDTLGNYNVIEFFVDTYETNLTSRDLSAEHRSRKRAGGPTLGRPRHEHVPYLPEHPKSGNKQRVIHPRGHNNLPNFIGRYFPPRDDPDQYQFYCASMLMLLKPWRKVDNDLKKTSQTWEAAFDEFITGASKETINILSGIQYYHQSRWSAMRQQDAATGASHTTVAMEEIESTDIDHRPIPSQKVLTDEGLQALESSEQMTMEELHAFAAIESARKAKVFEECNIEPWTEIEKRANNNIDVPSAVGGKWCTESDVEHLQEWRGQMQADVQKQNPEFDATSIATINQDDLGNVAPLQDVLTHNEQEPSVLYLEDSHVAEEALKPVEERMLRKDQYRAYDIITGHLQETLAGRKPTPLRMLIHGEPGTGKSQVIQTTTQNFIRRGVKYMLMKSAYTGVASSLICGKTTHSIAMISPRGDGSLSAESRRKLQRIWKHIKYLVIDEISMISKTFMAKLSRNISIGKMTDGEPVSPDSFGGISVILCGDFFQFPPVAGGVSDALYNTQCTVPKNREDSQAGRVIFEEFTTVVTLSEQMRVTDPVWLTFLQHLRYGQVELKDIEMLRRLVLTKKDAVKTDFTSEEWKNAALVTPRHAVRRLWNETALLKHGKAARLMILECEADDTIRKQPLTPAEKHACYVREKSLDSKQRKQELPPKMQMAIDHDPECSH